MHHKSSVVWSGTEIDRLKLYLCLSNSLFVSCIKVDILLQVTYELADHTELFQIDPKTGNITTMQEFDREEKDFYNVKVYATDNSPSSLYTDGRPNTGQQVFRIEIADKNDNPPRFTQKVYVAEAIPEDANINSQVTEVKALDNDTGQHVV